MTDLRLHHLDTMVGAVASLTRALAPGQASAVLGPAALAHLVDLLDHLDTTANDALVSTPDAFLANRFGLDPIDRVLLWTLAAPHLDPTLDDLIARAHDDLRMTRFDLALLLRAFTSTRSEAIALMRRLGPDGLLTRRGLITTLPASGTSPLHLALLPADHVAPFLAGLEVLGGLGGRMERFARRVRPTLGLDDIALPPALTETLLPILRGFRTKPPARGVLLGDGGLFAAGGLLIAIHGPEGSGRQTAMKALAGALGANLIIVDGRLLSFSPPDEQRLVLDTVTRDAELYGDLILIRDADRLLVSERPVTSALRHELETRSVVVLASTANVDTLPPELEALTLARVPMTLELTPEIQERLWVSNLPEHSAIVHDDVSFEAIHVTLSPLQVRKAQQLAYWTAPSHPEAPDRALLDRPTLHRAAKAQVSTTIGDLATVSEPRVTMSSLILDETTANKVSEIIGAARNRRTILEEWGLGARIGRGIGLVSLFDGDPGTGKTHAAEVIASELGLSLVHVNVASVVDKYIGETEKNLERIFRGARPDMSLLLFDEADSLFSKRTKDVERSADRYSNMDINMMLQLIERYPGITILTTNLKKAIDPAFERRFSFKVTFELPGPDERARIWRYFIAPDVKVGEAIDFEHLASVTLSGGEIKNALLRASYQAAVRGTLLTTDGLIRAAEVEAAAAGRLVRHHL